MFRTHIAKARNRLKVAECQVSAAEVKNYTRHALLVEPIVLASMIKFKQLESNHLIQPSAKVSNFPSSNRSNSKSGELIDADM